MDPQSHLFSYFAPDQRMPASHLLRKCPGKEANLCFAGHALMDNLHGLINDVSCPLG